MMAYATEWIYDIGYAISTNFCMVGAIDAFWLVAVPFHQLTTDNKNVY